MNNIKGLTQNQNGQNLFSHLNKDVMVSITDTRGILIYANEKYCESMGSYMHELIGETHKLFESRRHKDQKFGNLWKTIKKGKVWYGILKSRNCEGQVTWLETSISPVRNKNGNVNKYVSVYTDITERRKLKLTKILQKGKYKIDNLDIDAMILERSREPESIDFRKMTNSVIKNISETMDIQEIDFTVKVLVNTEFQSIPNLVFVLLKNLVHNAIKFNNINENPFINIYVFSKGKKIQIRIEDGGQGIPNRNLDKIFDLFYSDDRSESAGIGLGLYTVDNIVNELNGDIRVYSEVHKGTTFIINLPDYRANTRKQTQSTLSKNFLNHTLVKNAVIKFLI